MKAYYGSRFSPNMTKTPEGYLVCHNVPIARTGEYEYLGQELNLADYYDKLVKVYRSPEEVFSPAAMASFEGKSVTDEHPTEDVRPDNYSAYEKGQVLNVRKGSGSESDCLVADLLMKDPILMSEIEAGKREVSCGYDCLYEEIEPGIYQQRQICGNHVAVVLKGRAGDRIAIKDTKQKIIERRKSMLGKRNIFSKMFAAFVKDAEPEEIAEAMDAMTGMSGMKPEAPKTTDEGGSSPEIAACMKAIQELSVKVDALIQSDKEVHKEIPKDSLDALEAELETPAEQAKEDALGTEIKDGLGEESVTIPVEQMDEVPEKDKIVVNTDRNVLLQTVKAMKPVIAAMKDPAERKRATDALVSSVRGQMKAPAKDTGYAGIMQRAQANAREKAKDGAPKDNSDFGKKCAERNPHLKKQGGK